MRSIIALLLLLLLVLAGCTTVNIKTVDYCHNEAGYYDSTDPRCRDNLNPIRFDRNVR